MEKKSPFSVRGINMELWQFVKLEAVENAIPAGELLNTILEDRYKEQIKKKEEPK